jgi:phosphate transport system protein
MESLADLDPEAGPRLDQEDDVVDTLVGDFYTLLASEAEGMHVDTAIELSRVGRYMERIADHAVNIGEHVGFAVTGVFPRHGDIDEQ